MTQNTGADWYVSAEQIQLWKQQAISDLVPRIHRWGPIIADASHVDPANLEVKRVTIRNQKTRWASCSTRKTLSFNCQLMRASELARDYCVVHELCHLVHPHHQKPFWDLVHQVFPETLAGRHELRNLRLLRSL